MKALIEVYDKPLTGDPELRRRLSFGSDWITGGDLIRRRIEEELADSWHYVSPRQDLAEIAAGKGWLVDPEPGQCDPTPTQIIDRQVAIAFAAFQRNGFIMLVDDHQITDLNEPVNLRRDSFATFIKLTPLQGG